MVCKYFVVLNHKNGPVPILNKNDFCELFDTKEEAKEFGNETLIGGQYGCSVYETYI